MFPFQCFKGEKRCSGIRNHTYFIEISNILAHLILLSCEIKIDFVYLTQLANSHEVTPLALHLPKFLQRLAVTIYNHIDMIILKSLHSFDRSYLYPVYLSVTAIRALAKSRGYVIDCDVTPASDPAKNLRPFVL